MAKPPTELDPTQAKAVQAANGIIFVPNRVFELISAAASANQAMNSMGCGNAKDCGSSTNALFCTNADKCG